MKNMLRSAYRFLVCGGLDKDEYIDISPIFAKYATALKWSTMIFNVVLPVLLVISFFSNERCA